MALTERLALLVTLDADQAIKGLEKVGKTADKNLSKTTQRIDKVGQGMQKAGAAMAGAGGLIAVGLFKAAQSAEEANLAVVKLENSLKNNPRLAGESSKAFLDLADSIQDKTAADGDAIVAGQAMLATFKVTGKQIRDLTPLVVDYARKFDTDLVSANAAVGKALDGSVGALKRNGVSIDENLFKTDRYAAVQKALAEQVGGFAEAEGKTFAGSLERLKNQMGDLAEGVGVGAVDAFTSMFDAVDPLIDRFNDLDPRTQSLVGKFAAFGATGLIAAGGLSVVIGKLIVMRENLGPLVAKLRTAEGGLTKLGKAGALVGAALAVKALYDYDQALNDITINVDEFAAGLAKVSDAGDAELDTFLAINRATGELDDVVSQLADSNVVAAQRLVDYAAANGFAAEEVEALQEVVDRKAEADVQGAKDQAANSAAVDAAVGPMDELGDSTGGVVERLKELSDALKAQFDPMFAAQDASIKLAEAQYEVAAAEAEFGANSAEAQVARRDLLKATVDYEGSLLSLQTAVEAGDVSVDEYRATLNRWVEQGLISRTAADEAAFSFGVLGSNARAVPGSVETSVSTPGLGSAISNINYLISRLGVMQGTYVANVGTDFLYAGGRASGGPVSAGRTYLVGERGPELLTMGASGHVTPNSAMSGGNSYSITVNSLDPKAAGKVVVEAIQSFESANGKGWRG